MDNKAIKIPPPKKEIEVIPAKKDKKVVRPQDSAKVLRNRIFVALLSIVLFVIALYFIYVTIDEDNKKDEKKLDFVDIEWRFATIIRLLIALFGYAGAVLYSKKFLVLTMALIMVDLILSFMIYCLSFKDLSDLYDKYLVYLASIQRETSFKENDCNFIKIFRRRIIENLILVCFYIFYVDCIIATVHRNDTDDEDKEESKDRPKQSQFRVTAMHPKWALIIMSLIHFFYSIYLFWSKTFRSDKRIQIFDKKDFKYVFLWTLLAFLSMLIAFLTPFALMKINLKNKFLFNFFISIVMSSTFFGAASFLLIVFREIFSLNPDKDFYCNTSITSVDSIGSIFVLLIVDKVMISLLLSLAHEIRRIARGKSPASKI